MTNTPNQNQPESPKNLVEMNPFNVNYIRSQARKALKEMKARLEKERKFEEIIREYKKQQDQLKSEIASNVGKFVNLDNQLKKTLDDTVVEVFDQIAQEEVVDAELLNREVYGGFEYHVDFELVELFKRVRNNRESKNSEYTTVSPHASIDELTSSFVYDQKINTFVVTEDGGKFSRVIGVVSREALTQEPTHLSVGNSSKLLLVTEPLPVETVHSLMFQHKLAHYPLLDLENKLVDTISFQEMELIIKKRTKKSIQMIDTSRKLHEVLPENRPVRQKSEPKKQIDITD